MAVRTPSTEDVTGLPPFPVRPLCEIGRKRHRRPLERQERRIAEECRQPGGRRQGHERYQVQGQGRRQAVREARGWGSNCSPRQLGCWGVESCDDGGSHRLGERSMQQDLQQEQVHERGGDKENLRCDAGQK